MRVRAEFDAGVAELGEGVVPSRPAACDFLRIHRRFERLDGALLRAVESSVSATSRRVESIESRACGCDG